MIEVNIYSPHVFWVGKTAKYLGDETLLRLIVVGLLLEVLVVLLVLVLMLKLTLVLMIELALVVELLLVLLVLYEIEQCQTRSITP